MVNLHALTKKRVTIHEKVERAHWASLNLCCLIGSNFQSKSFPLRKSDSIRDMLLENSPKDCTD